MQLSTIVNSNAVTMSSREIAELTSKELSHVHRDIRAMIESLKDDPVLDDVKEEKDARGYTVAFHLNKDLTLTLVAGYNVKLRLAIIKRWQELEEKERFQNKLDTTAEQDIRILSAVSDMLRLSESGRIGMVRKYIENETPKLKHYLPAYAVDAPAGTVTGSSSEVTKSATDLLVQFGAGTNARKFNELLSAKGFLETKTRPSTSGTKVFKSITEKGLKYGKNLTSDKNQKETQPHWYESKFKQLLEELGL